MSDLLLHFLAGGLISVIIMFVFSRYNAETQRRQDWVVILACILPLFVGLGKEGYDKWFGPGTPELADVTLTWFGGMFGAFSFLIADLFRHK